MSPHELLERSALSVGVVALALVASLAQGLVLWPALSIAGGRLNSAAVLGVVLSVALWVLLLSAAVAGAAKIVRLTGRRHFAVVVGLVTVVALEVGVGFRALLVPRQPDSAYPTLAHAGIYLFGFVGAFLGLSVSSCRRVGA